jgi:hypothetical protein
MNTLLAACLHAPVGIYAHAKSDVDNSTKAPKRIWESAPDKKEALVAEAARGVEARRLRREHAAADRQRPWFEEAK